MPEEELHKNYSELPKKFYRNENGHYWENRGEILPSRNFFRTGSGMGREY